MHVIHTFLLLPLPGSRFVENRELLKECSDFDRRNVFIIQAAMTGQMQIPVVDLLRTVTGWDIGWDEGLTTGRRILTLRQAFNVREGLTPNDYQLPKRFNEPLAVGPGTGHEVPFEVLREGYFRTMGWDPKTGSPTPETLAALQIELR
jgi:aldehyde:ferredoxin oxidoreductase